MTLKTRFSRGTNIVEKKDFSIDLLIYTNIEMTPSLNASYNAQLIR